jgi:hypothetical protein
LIILNNCFSLAFFILWQVHNTMLIGSGRVMRSGRRVRSSRVQSGWVVGLGPWVGSSGPVRSSWVPSGWVIGLGQVVGFERASNFAILRNGLRYSI